MVNDTVGKEKAEDKEGSGNLDNHVRHAARGEKRAERGKGDWEKGKVVFQGPDQLWLPCPGAEHQATGKIALDRPCSCGHCLTVRFLHLSAAHDWFLSPLN